ncbi:hypothetical protein [Marinovum sp.]|uniref:hypothetical protein n=1 Tax=Marinovum sp. TaxID=2024839 RepID=UPI003A95AF90
MLIDIESLIGSVADDILTGSGAASDRRQDVAVFSYDRALYDITTDAGSTTTVAYTGPGAGDGTDTLTEIEVLRFTEPMAISSSEPAAGAGAAQSGSPSSDGNAFQHPLPVLAPGRNARIDGTLRVRTSGR